MRGENNRRKKKKELIPSHAVISSPSICHTRRSGNPVGLMWHFVIRLIMFPAGSSPSNHPHRHTTPPKNASGPCTLFSEFMGQWELDVKDVDKAGPTQQWGGTVLWSHGQCSRSISVPGLLLRTFPHLDAAAAAFKTSFLGEWRK